ADPREVRHAHAPLAVLGDDGKPPLRIEIAGTMPLERREKIAVDEVDDLEVARQQPLDEGDGPGLEGLRQQGVIGVGEYAGGDGPALVPAQAVLVYQQPH